MSGPKLGRKPKDQQLLQAQHEQEYADEDINQVEERFGVGKRRYGLDKIMAKLSTTSETVISMIFLVVNLDRIVHFLCQLFVVWVTSLLSRVRSQIYTMQIKSIPWYFS